MIKTVRLITAATAAAFIASAAYAGTLDDVKNSFGDIADEAAELIPDLTFGVISFDDYNFGTMGAGADKPYHPRQQQTTDLALVQTALDGLYAGGGWDWPESTVEALYQAATGAGYDQNCNGTCDPAAATLCRAPFGRHVGNRFWRAVGARRLICGTRTRFQRFDHLGHRLESIFGFLGQHSLIDDDQLFGHIIPAIGQRRNGLFMVSSSLIQRS